MDKKKTLSSSIIGEPENKNVKNLFHENDLILKKPREKKKPYMDNSFMENTVQTILILLIISLFKI
ncbi:protein of unknown function [Acetoanaerobium sticklandii]|uniref:Uncharacterized protein n=1 Tax=Acetoanaerobium sticklandii (strain ATCC 12662 / DSM 519 / JCM 1433 / CCUG 9281 / NCIMB 10654 / HF) TaxID=499177 RepID=E3PY62_ACESD|nr:hypothetical protein [Acetoanaerobium sticklandii]CBH21377.1 protein of unknown function [Acetoanaerobium sticklandii]